MLKVLHLSDLHLGYSYSQKQSATQIMNDELVHSLERAVEFCIIENVDILMLAGDVFHHSKPGYATERLFLQCLRKLDSAGVVVVYCGGNHDPNGSLVNESSYCRIPNWIAFVNPQAEVVRREIRGVPVCFVGSGYEGKRHFARITEYPNGQELRVTPETVVLGISHLSVDAKEAALTGDVYNSTRLVDLQALDYDYFALGHIHIRQVLGELQNIAYSGNLQGLHVNEPGDRGGLLVELHYADRNGWTAYVEEVNFSGLRFETCHLDVANYVELADLEYALEEHLHPPLQDGTYRYARVCLEGKCEYLDALHAAVLDMESYLARGRLLGVEIDYENVQSAAEIGEETLGGMVLEAINRLREEDLVVLKREGAIHKNDDLQSLVAYLKAQVYRKLR